MRTLSAGSLGAMPEISAILSAIRCCRFVASSSPAGAAPRAAATWRASWLAPSRLGSVSTNTTAMPASRSCKTTSVGPIVPSVISTVGRSASTASLLTACPPEVMRGRPDASGNVVEMSRPTTLSPRPSPKMVAAIEPEMSRPRMRSVDVTVTSVSPARSCEMTVAGRVCSGFSATGSMLESASKAVDGPSKSRGLSTRSRSARGTDWSPTAAGDASGAEADEQAPSSVTTSTAVIAAAARTERRGRVVMRSGVLVWRRQSRPSGTS